MRRDVRTPDWAKDAVFYQIFPDRFAASSGLTKPSNLEPWSAAPTPFGFKGGDLLGVVEHLDWLRDLGITALYLNPVFQSTANHRYHTHDYFQVDPILGGNAALHELIAAAHACGMRLILDGVFNHTGRGFLQFNHALENGRASPYLDWYQFDSFPIRAYGGKPNYACWFDLPGLPKLNLGNPQVREFIFSVAEHWLRQGIDGWRLDVPEEIDDDEFWREFRRRVKRINPDAYVVGEIWHRADRWLQGDQFDGVTNYPLTRAFLSFFVDQTPAVQGLLQPESYGAVQPMLAPELAKTLQEIFGWYPWEITLAQLNLLDSHDTARFITIAGGDPEVLKLAYGLLFACPGAPMVFYGDEIGLPGGRDPDCRRGMPWKEAEWNHDLLAAIKGLARLRYKHPALRRGDFEVLYARERVLAIKRAMEGDTVIVALNAGTTPATFNLRLPGPNHLVAEDTGESVGIGADGLIRELRLPAHASRVWLVG